MTTKRTPLARRQRPRVTEAAVEAYRRMKQLALECTCPPPEAPTSPSWKYQPPCAACEEYDRLDAILHAELRARPWEIPCFQSEPPDADAPSAHWERLAYQRYLALERAIAR